jgi:PAS domain S-box-containing protein
MLASAVEALAILGKVVGAGCLYLGETTAAPGGGLRAEILARWSGASAAQQPQGFPAQPELMTLPLEWEPWLSAGETIHGRLPASATEAVAHICCPSGEECLIAPLMTGTQLWGILHAARPASGVWRAGAADALRQAGALLLLRLQGWRKLDALEEDRLRYQTLLDQAPQAHHTLDSAGRITEVNQTWLSQLGYTREEVLGRWFGDFLHPSQREPFRNLQENWHLQGKPRRLESQLLRKDGSFFDACFVCLPGNPANRQAPHAQCTFFDITELKIANETLAHSELLKSLVLDSMNELVIYEDLQQNIIWANQTAQEHACQPDRQIQGQRCYAALYDRDSSCPGCPVLTVLNTKEPQRAELQAEDGRWWEVIGTPVFHPENGDQLVGVVKITREVTNKKNALKRLKDDEARYRAVVEDQTEFVCRFTPDGKLTFANTAICRLYRIDQITAIGSLLSDFLTPDELRRFTIRLERITPRHPIQTFRVHSITPQGRDFWADWTIRAIYNYDGFLVEYQAVGRDVTVEQTARLKLAESQASLEEAQQIAHIGSWRWDVEKNEVHWSNETWRIFGLPPQPGPLPRGYFRDYIHPEDYPRLEQAVAGALAEDAPYDVHYRILRPDGTVRRIHSRGVVRSSSMGQPFRFTGVIHDVTDLQAAQEALALSQRRLKALVDSMPDLLFTLDREGRYLEYYAPSTELLAVPPGTLLGRTMRETLPAAVADQAYAALHQAFLHGTVATFEYALELPAGRHWFEARMNRCSDGEVLAIVRDITPRMQTRQELIASQERFRNIVELATEGVLVMDEHEKISYVNERMAAMLSCACTELVGRPVASIMVPEEREDHARVVEQRRRGESSTYERRMQCKNGRVIDLMVSARALTHADGSFGGSFAMITDITAQKEAEQALKDSEARYRLLFEQLLDPVYVHHCLHAPDHETYILEANRAACELLGYTLEEMRQLRPEDLDADIDHSNQIDESVMDLLAGHPVVFSRRHRAKSGKIIPVEIHARTMEYKSETVIISVVRDIRHRLEAEEELKHSEQRFRRMFESHVRPMMLIEPRTGQIIDANAAAQHYYGYSREDFLRMDISDINMLPPEEVATARQRVSEDDCTHFIFPHRLANGEIRTVEVSVSQIEVGGQPLLFSIMNDITEREYAMEMLRASEVKFRSLLDVAPIGIGLVRDREVQWTNRAMQEMLCYPSEALDGQSARMLYPTEEEFITTGQSYLQAIDKTGHGIFETRWVRSNGAILDIVLTTSLINPLDSTQGVIFTATDITQRKLTEADRDRLIADLRQSLTQIRTLSGLLPICANCKKIRNDTGYWQQIEGYIQEHSTAQFSHSICPECVSKLYPDYKAEDADGDEPAG